MQSTIICDIDSQIIHLQETLGLFQSLRVKCIKLEEEKNEAVNKCKDLKLQLERLRNRKCANCSVLMHELRKEKKDKEKLKREEKAKLLKTIAKTLESYDEGNTNHVNQLFTELVNGRLNESPEQRDKRGVSLIEDRESSEDENGSKVLVNETIVEYEDKEFTAFKKRPIIIPETEAMDCSPKKIASKELIKCNDNAVSKNSNPNGLRENTASHDNVDIVEQSSKKLRLSPILSSQKVSPPRDKMTANHSIRSPSVLSEIIQIAGGSTPSVSAQDEKEVAWKMKPSTMVESSSSGSAGNKRLKQMTLSLTKPEKRHDISLSQNFKGGLAKLNDEDNDVILPSPEQLSKKTFSRKQTTCESLGDPDMTVFNPGITSTCLPVPGETSFDRLPEVQKSPKYKYRRETVRKKVERMKIPGQDCDQCAKYYEAAGLDQTQEVRTRLNQCSRHRDKYQLRANTPPGFWDPVLPTTPEDNQGLL